MVPGRSPPRLEKTEYKNQWKPAAFDDFNGNFAIFKVFLFLSNFLENVRKNLEKFRNEHSHVAKSIFLKSK